VAHQAAAAGRDREPVPGQHLQRHHPGHRLNLGPASDGGRPDAELLRRHVAGDPDAFGELFRRHRDRLWAVAVRTLHDPDDAADALQEAMISAFRRAAEFRGDAAVTTWLHRIVVNACLDQLRRRAARPTVAADDEAALDALGQRQGRLAADPAPASDTALDVEAALQLLPAGQRAALVLVDMLGYPVATVADVLGVSPGTVKSRCARGRARLLPHLAHLRNTGPPGDPARNQTTAGYVPPSQGVQPPPAVQPRHPVAPADQRTAGEGGSTDHARPS
jgi:RNA polymerase sigma-70 factor, ECF subfamily